MTFFEQTIGSRLLERLDLFSINPSSILNLSTGMDWSFAALYKYYPNAEIKNDSTDLKNHSVDFVFSNLLLPRLQNLEQLAQFFQEIKRILKPGGLFLFSSLGPDTSLKLQEDKLLLMDLHDIGDRLLQTPLRDPVIEREDLNIESPHSNETRAEVIYGHAWGIEYSEQAITDRRIPLRIF